MNEFIFPLIFNLFNQDLQINTQEAEFVKLVNENQKLVHKICNLYGHSVHDREDLFQEIIVQLWKAYPAFRGDSRFSTWMYRIALNTAISGLRRKKGHISYIDPATIGAGIQDETDTTGQEEKLQQLYAAIRKLTEVERAVIMLFLENKSYEEMEEIMGINQNNLRVKMNRIKDKLRKLTNRE